MEDEPAGIPPEATLAVEKPFKCKTYGCDKAYKNMNGLKYHRTHGACNQNNLAGGPGDNTSSAIQFHVTANGDDASAPTTPTSHTFDLSKSSKRKSTPVS